MNRKLYSFIFLLVCGLASQAHEFWLQPVKFILKSGEYLVVNFRVGENFFGEQWSLKKDRLMRLELHQKNTMKSLKEEVVEGDKDNLKMPLATEGTYMLIMQSNETFSDLEAEKFNAYLKEDELDDAYAHRKKTNTLDKNGTEVYARYAKLLVQVGGKTDNTFRKTAGLPVEIIPEQNPYSLKVGDPIQFKIFFEGKPLFGAKVRVWNYYDNRTTVQNVYSQQDGTISTRISSAGAWMVSFVKMVPSKDPKADWQSYWASLVFGVNQ
jgi:uncharacterized GH25 family protein